MNITEEIDRLQAKQQEHFLFSVNAYPKHWHFMVPRTVRMVEDVPYRRYHHPRSFNLIAFESDNDVCEAGKEYPVLVDCDGGVKALLASGDGAVIEVELPWKSYTVASFHPTKNEDYTPEVVSILQLYPEGIDTVAKAAHVMAELVKAGLNWHWDDDPRECGFADSVGHAFNIISGQLWTVAGQNFPLKEGDTHDAPMWEGLIDGLSIYNDIEAFRADTDEHGMVYVAAHGLIAKVPRDEWKQNHSEEFEDADAMLDWLEGKVEVGG